MKTVVITGASDGIGAAIAKRLAGEDYTLVLCARDEQKLMKVAEASNNAKYYAFDINDRKKRDEFITKIDNVDVLINNAGIWHKVGDIESLSDEKIEEVLQTNLLAQILLTKGLLPKIRESKEGKIINIISKSGIVSQEGQAVYSASKYGMRGFTDVLRQDVKHGGIRVGAVYQSGTNTQMFTKAGEDFAVETFTEPQDLAEVVSFMLSRPKKLWINEIRIEK